MYLNYEMFTNHSKLFSKEIERFVQEYEQDRTLYIRRLLAELKESTDIPNESLPMENRTKKLSNSTSNSKQLTVRDHHSNKSKSPENGTANNMSAEEIQILNILLCKLLSNSNAAFLRMMKPYSIMMQSIRSEAWPQPL